MFLHIYFFRSAVCGWVHINWLKADATSALPAWFFVVLRAGRTGILIPAMPLALVLGVQGLWEQLGQPRAAPGTGAGSQPAPASSPAQLTGHSSWHGDV